MTLTPHTIDAPRPSCQHLHVEEFDCACAFGCAWCGFSFRCVDCNKLLKGNPNKRATT